MDQGSALPSRWMVGKHCAEDRQRERGPTPHDNSSFQAVGGVRPPALIPPDIGHRGPCLRHAAVPLPCATQGVVLPGPRVTASPDEGQAGATVGLAAPGRRVLVRWVMGAINGRRAISMSYISTATMPPTTGATA